MNHDEADGSPIAASFLGFGWTPHDVSHHAREVEPVSGRTRVLVASSGEQRAAIGKTHPA
jgi:hypothetical protein